MRRRHQDLRPEIDEALLRSRLALGLVPSPAAVNQQNWYIAGTGALPVGWGTPNDSNDGLTMLTPLASWGQYIKRAGYEENFDGRSVDVFVAGALSDADPIIKRARTTGYNSHYGIHGILAPQLTTTLSSFSASVPSTNTHATFTVPAGLTAAMVGCLLFFPASNVYSQVLTVTGQTATCLDPTTAPTIATSVTRITPQAGDPVIVYRGASAVLAVEWQSTTRLFGASFPGPFLLEGISARGTASLVKRAGNDNAIDPTIQFCQFQDLDVVADGAMLFRHNSVQVNGDTTIRSRFDSTQGVYWQNGNAIMAASGVSSPNCQLTGFEVGTFFVNNVNAFGGNVGYQITHFFAAAGRIGYFITGSGGFGRVYFFAVSASMKAHGSADEDFGSVQGSAAFQIGYEAHLIYGATRQCFVVGSAGGGGSFSFSDGAGQNAWPALAANGTQAAQAALKSQADLNAAPFNGKAYDPNSLAALTAS